MWPSRLNEYAVFDSEGAKNPWLYAAVHSDFFSGLINSMLFKDSLNELFASPMCASAQRAAELATSVNYSEARDVPRQDVALCTAGNAARPPYHF